MLNFRREKNPRKFVELKELLGMGSFGSVYRGIIIDPTLDPKGLNKEAAVKIISYSPEELHQLGRELYFLKNLNSPYIVHYVDSILTGTELWIVMELCDAGSLLDLYHATQKTLDEPALKAVVACSILGLLHIHEKRSIHRDIKAGNILLSSQGKTLLSDFGVSTQLMDDSRRKTVIGTPYWMAPEILQETSYGENADIWSLGITIIECAEGQPPFYGVKPLRAMFMISSKPSPSLKDAESYSDNMKDFISKCLQKNPYNRPQSKDLITHPWIATEVAQMSASPEGSNLQVLKDLVTDNWQAILDMRKCIQEVTVTPGSPERSQLNSISDEADTLRLNRKASMVQTNSMADTIKAGAGGRMTGMDDTMDAERGDNVSNLYTSVVRVMIPHPMSPFVADAAGKGGGNSPRNVAPNTRSVSITREHLASRENIHLTPGQMREWQSQSIDGAREGSFIRVNPYPHERHGSIVRRLSAMPNSQYNSNVEAALKYFRNEAVENSLMESRNNYYAGLMTEIEMAQPNFDPDSMSPERRENYHRELQEIDAQYMDELKKLETNYWEKKKQLFLTYELGNDENSG